MITVSEELMLIINLKNTAINHKEHCNTNCNISLMQLKMAAQNIARWVRTYEQDEANKIIKEMPTI